MHRKNNRHRSENPRHGHLTFSSPIGQLLPRIAAQVLQSPMSTSPRSPLVLLPFLLLPLLHLLQLCGAGSASPAIFSEREKSDAVHILKLYGESLASLEDKYNVLRALQVLGVEQEDPATCENIGKVLASSNSPLKDVFYASKVGQLLRCSVVEADIKVTISNLQSLLSSEDGLLNLYFSVGTLSVLKSWIKNDLELENGARVFDAIKALSQQDGTWKYGADEDVSTAKAAGIAFETLGNLVSIAGSSIDESTIRSLRTIPSKLFDSIEKYEDGTHFFSEKEVDVVSGIGGPLAATSHVIKGVKALASVIPGRFKISSEKIVGIANFFLSAGILGSSKDTFYILDALSALDSNSFAVPLVISVSPSVLSQTERSALEVTVTTVLGSAVPASITISKATREGQKKPVLTNKVLEPKDDNIIHTLQIADSKLDLGKYIVAFEAKPLQEGVYVVGNLPTKTILVTGLASIENVEVRVLDSDTGSADITKRWDPSAKEQVSLFATHLQKLHFAVDVLSPLKNPIQPHQVFIKLTHESKAEHLFLLTSTGQRFELTLDLLALVEKKLQYLSGVYTIELSIGDDTMENSLIWSLGTVELDLPDAPDGVQKPTATEIPSPYGPKPEIAHIFRQADKRAPSSLSTAFTVLTLLPLLGFLVGLNVLDTNLKLFPKSGFPTAAALCFHAGIAAILGLYVLFWLKLNLFQTLKFLGILGSLITIPGYYILSHLADSTSKQKTA